MIEILFLNCENLRNNELQRSVCFAVYFWVLVSFYTLILTKADIKDNFEPEITIKELFRNYEKTQ